MIDTPNTVDEFDMAGEGAAQAAPNSIARLTAKMQEAINLQETIDQLEADLSAAKAALQTIRTIEMPDMMVEMQTDSFTHGGYKFDLDVFVSGSLPKDPEARRKAIDWLERHDGAELLTSNVEVSFARSQYEEAQRIYEFLAAQGLAATLESTVHAQTLQAFARQRIRDGEEIDFEVIGLYHGKVVKFKPVKEKVSKKKGA